MENNELLKKIGLRENEVKIYLALLELGSTKVDNLSRHIGLPRTTVYGSLNSLLLKGFASSVIKSGVKYFESTSPERLLLAEKEKLEEIKKAIPQLSLIQNTVGEKPSVEMYEGKEGLKSVYEDLLKTAKHIYGYGTTHLLVKLLEFYIPNYMKQRAKKGIKSHIITENSKYADEMKSRDKDELRETRFLDGLEKTTTVTYIYDDKIAIIGLLKEHPIGVIIKNKEFSNSQKVIFDILWKIAKS